ncbi:MAG: hypothetical protein PHU33_14520 [Bacteroidales bacterium]|nr:hypothetical protein [Bacteroidales bacterium]
MNNKKNIMLIVVLVILLSCEQNCEKKRISYFNHLNTKFLWQIIGADSSYHEFYFDNHQLMHHDDCNGTSLILIEDSTVYYNFLDSFFCSSDTVKQSEAVLDLFHKVCNPNIKVISIKPIGCFLYHISSNIDENYSLFSSEATKRYFKYKGYNRLDSDTMNYYYEEIILPSK